MHLFFTILLFIFTINSFAQDTTQISMEPVKTNIVKYSLEERKLLYPFLKANKIKLVSFHWLQEKSPPSGRLRTIYQIPLLNDTVWQSKLDQAVALDGTGIDTLTDILYNTCSKWTFITRQRGMCYLPRNAVVFYDANNKPFEYIEICFACENSQLSNKRIQNLDECDLMYHELKSFFERRGLKTNPREFIEDKKTN